MKTLPALPLLVVASLLLSTACTGSRDTAPAPAAEAVADAESGGEARRLFDALDAHCGRAFPGVVELDEPAGAEPVWSAAQPILHVRACEPNLKALSVALGEDRSTVWLLSVRDGRLRLQHLAYNDDASPRPGSGRFSVARVDSPAGRVEFEHEFQDPSTPAQNTSLALDESSLVYATSSGERRLRVRFDLATAIPAPPPPWLEAPIR